MNAKGHVPTLVAAHPGNRNAVKSGVYSPTALAARIHELDAAIAARPAREAAADLLRREVASLAVLGEAMDEALARDGLHSRRGEPRTLVSQRLRVNEKLRRTLEAYQQVSAEEPSEDSQPLRVGEIEAAPTAGDEEQPEQETLPQTIALAHDRREIGLLAPAEFVPELFLEAVIRTRDSTVRTDDRLKARRMLTKRTRNRPVTCVCSTSGFRAQNHLYFKEWVIDIAEAGMQPKRDDRTFAAVVRRIAAGETLLPWSDFAQTAEAVGDVLREEEKRARGAKAPHPLTEEQDQTISPFWRMALARDVGVTASARLKAFAALDEEGVLPRCTCKPSQRDDFHRQPTDAWRAFIIRVTRKETYVAALYVARYPETYLAVRDAIDAKIVEAIGATVRDELPPGRPLFEVGLVR